MTAGKTARGEEILGRRTSWRFRTSIRRSLAEKKSEPKIGRGTSARRNGWTALSLLKRSDRRRDPYVAMAEPLAATKVPEGAEAGAAGESMDFGKTETSAPLSTRKCRPEMSSRRDMAPRPALMAEIVGEEEVVPEANAARRERFPAMASSGSHSSLDRRKVCHSEQHLCHTWCVVGTSGSLAKVTDAEQQQQPELEDPTARRGPGVDPGRQRKRAPWTPRWTGGYSPRWPPCRPESP